MAGKAELVDHAEPLEPVAAGKKARRVAGEGCRVAGHHGEARHRALRQGGALRGGTGAGRVDAIPNSWPLTLRLSSDNPAYSNYRRQVDEVHIIGRVVWFARSI